MSNGGPKLALPVLVKLMVLSRRAVLTRYKSKVTGVCPAVNIKLPDGSKKTQLSWSM